MKGETAVVCKPGRARKQYDQDQSLIIEKREGRCLR